jgi:hypothetical protein
VRRLTAVLVLSAVVGCGAQQPQPRRIVAGAHRYQLVPAPAIPYDDAEKQAAANFGPTCHLARLETSNYGVEMKAIHDAVFSLRVRPDKWYWIGASRRDPRGDAIDGWRWNDGTDVPTAITATWGIDLMEGLVPEGACVSLDEDRMRIGDYAAANPTGVVDGYVLELD